MSQLASSLAMKIFYYIFLLFIVVNYQAAPVAFLTQIKH